MTISNLILSNNTANEDGGGIYAHILSGTVSMSNSAMFGNTGARGSHNCKIEGGSMTTDDASSY